ncbi:uncharacterized protein SPPG_04128 [Spizellomyces punctatus DAOM BR117]|uniref:Vta1/callose synthase N-terminal domain-containing protein n=1 Tax=Spizellomyces punctatus (strain DAOM BR117) TaxID=645134 RepID=A0A0L0HJG4_SPIPD|nr:uncharacterized protein SPPG_04128 [Spizellomyces punctatus DAOM BR117]KND01035.1 hypothetical protein SPPG_04128 [Spizellomyces punctatus DAOM BR117]|eukprot:XP_016609074.1 hypothetical protein SPPG_04128 [Spizellomyces punctatus DAOM BR117]
MPGNPPDELKFVNAYLQRAQELQTKEPIVAYYCKYYAAKLAIDKGGKSKEAQLFLLGLMDELEQDRKNISGNEAVTNDVVGYAHIENFALRIFTNADNEDRQGRASKKTAKTFLASSIFLELLKVFGEIDTEVQDKIRYAKFKAADIIKALREGRTPTPGMPGEQPPESAQPTAPPEPHPNFGTPYDPSYTPTQPTFDANVSHSGEASYASPSSHCPSHQTPFTGSETRPYVHPSAPSAGSGHHSPSPAPASPSSLAPKGSFEVNYKTVQAAQKHSRFAISALQYDDIPTAIDNLEQALALLRPLRKT